MTTQATDMPAPSCEAITSLLRELLECHEQLQQVVASKLDAIRRMDTEAIQSCGAREAFLDGKIRQAEGRRQGLVRAMGGRERTLSELAGRLDEPHRSRVLVLGQQLRAKAEAVGRLNQIAAAVTEAMLTQYRQLYEAIRPTGGSSGIYSRRGHAGGTHVARMLDAVG